MFKPLKYLGLASLVLLCSGNASNIIFAPTVKTFFPLEKGSFWLSQDSSFTGEGEQILTEDLGLESKTIFFDSVVSYEKIDSGWYIHALEFVGEKKTAVKLRYYIDTIGYVFEGIYGKKGFEQMPFPIAKTIPQTGDTIYEDGWDNDRPLIYTVQGDTALLAAPPGSENTTIIKYVRGIGQVNRAYGVNFSRNLIKYRIGEGAVVSKHWLMDIPE